jgi:CheY-like chemotaxis protein
MESFFTLHCLLGRRQLWLDKKYLSPDDEIHFIHVVAIKLRNNGFEVVAANNSQEALDFIQAETPDLVVLDSHMDMVWTTVVERIRQNPILGKLPVVLLAKSRYTPSRKDIERLGICATLNKPFSPKELLAIIRDKLRATSNQPAERPTATPS